jgi:hypothetical protein
VALGKVGVMDHVNWGYIQLDLVAPAFGGLQVWWFSSIFRRREQEGPLAFGYRTS